MADVKWTQHNMDAVLTAATKRALTAVGQTLETACSGISPIGQYPAGSGRVGGRLKGSITYAVKDGAGSRPRSPARSGDGVSAPTDDMTVHIGTNVEYAAYVEYGTRFHPEPNPPPTGFMRGGLDNNRDTVMRLYADKLREGLKNGR
jgi:phage gpG-like protein